MSKIKKPKEKITVGQKDILSEIKKIAAEARADKTPPFKWSFWGQIKRMKGKLIYKVKE